MRQLSIWLVGFAIFGLVQKSALGQAQTDDPRSFAGPSMKHLDGRKIVFAVNEAGESMALFDHLSEVNEDGGLKMIIQTVNWCRKDTRRADYADQQAQLAAACKLAAMAKLLRRDAPGADIYFVGHGAGARIALVAAEMLPERSVSRILLIAPGVSSTYDLRPALRASRSGIDSYWSTEDDFLERMSESLGTADGVQGQAAGRVGFRTPLGLDPRERQTYSCNVRQYRFNDAVNGGGGHTTWLLRKNMKKYVAPLFFQPEIVCSVNGAPALAAPIAPPTTLPTPAVPDVVPAPPDPVSPTPSAPAIPTVPPTPERPPEMAPTAAPNFPPIPPRPATERK